MIRPALAALLALALGLAATPALADPPADATYTGGCAFSATTVPGALTGSGPPEFVGTLHGRLVAYSPTFAHNPVTVVSLTCEFLVDNVSVATVTRPGAGPVGVVEHTPMRFQAADDAFVQVCTRVDLVDAHGQAVTRDDECGFATHPVFPPPWVTDLVRVVGGWIDSVACEQLPPLPPNDLVWIDEEGDVYVAGEPFWDCPPYEWA